MATHDNIKFTKGTDVVYIATTMVEENIINTLKPITPPTTSSVPVGTKIINLNRVEDRFIITGTINYGKLNASETKTTGYDKKELLALGQIRMFEGNRGHLARIVVNPTARGKGFGRIFCEKLISEAKKLNCRTISLRVVKDNSVAINLYKKLGFIIPAEQPDNTGENIYYMELL